MPCSSKLPWSVYYEALAIIQGRLCIGKRASLLIAQATACHHDEQQREPPKTNQSGQVSALQQDLHWKQARYHRRRSKGINGCMEQDSHEQAPPGVVEDPGKDDGEAHRSKNELADRKPVRSNDRPCG